MGEKSPGNGQGLGRGLLWCAGIGQRPVNRESSRDAARAAHSGPDRVRHIVRFHTRHPDPQAKCLRRGHRDVCGSSREVARRHTARLGPPWKPPCEPAWNPPWNSPCQAGPPCSSAGWLITFPVPYSPLYDWAKAGDASSIATAALRIIFFIGSISLLLSPPAGGSFTADSPEVRREPANRLSELAVLCRSRGRRCNALMRRPNVSINFGLIHAVVTCAPSRFNRYEQRHQHCRFPKKSVRNQGRRS